MTPSRLDPEQQAHSDALAGHVRAEIQAAGGSIPFSRFMELLSLIHI